MNPGDRPRGLDARYYTDPAVFRDEVDRIFARTWIMVGHHSQVARPGDVITAQVGDESVVVANAGGTMRAFYNVCQHRGHPLVLHEQQAGVASLACPYHAWVYDLGGRLVRSRGVDVGELCVPSVRLESMAGFLFANLDDGAPSLTETVPGIEAELVAIAPDADERVLADRRTMVIDANWKVAVENYNECYHCPNVHKAFTAGVVSAASYRITPRGRCIHHTAEGAEAGRSAYTRHADGNDYGAFYVWPLSSIQCYPGRVLNTFRWIPDAVDRTTLIREWWFDRPDPTDAQREVIELDWTTTVAEDLDIMNAVQRGVTSRGYRPGPLVESANGVATVQSEDSVPHLHRLLREALGE